MATTKPRGIPSLNLARVSQQKELDAATPTLVPVPPPHRREGSARKVPAPSPRASKAIGESPECGAWTAAGTDAANRGRAVSF